MNYYRPIIQTDRLRPKSAHVLAGGWAWFSHAEKITRQGKSKRIKARDIPADILQNLTAKRGTICGLDMASPQVMGILNVTPDSFSDGGKHVGFDAAINHAKAMVAQGATLLDIGGESTRPGADFVAEAQEIARTIPVIEALKENLEVPISIDTRKADVARAALRAGVGLFNDVTALEYDPKSLELVAKKQPYVCLMHSVKNPKTMQNDPKYENVLLDVYDYLAARIAACEQAGLDRSRIVIDPGIGFGKTQDHNLQLIRGLSLFHGLGCPILLGVSRKRFIGDIGGAQEAADRTAGSFSIGLEGLKQGVQILRVHDVAQTVQALRLWQATL